MKQTFYTCRHCGNIIAMIRDEGVPVYCCGEKMQKIHPGDTGASREKHAPVWQMEDGGVVVTVGAVPHPMTPEHYIQWICLETEKGLQVRHLTPQDPPEARFSLDVGDTVQAVYAFCNQHELWKSQD